MGYLKIVTLNRKTKIGYTAGQVPNAVPRLVLCSAAISELVHFLNSYLKILAKVFCYEPLCMMHRVEILHSVVADHENMVLEDTWILSGTFLSISIHSCMALHNSDMEACLVYIEILGLHFLLASAGIALRVVMNTNYIPER